MLADFETVEIFLYFHDITENHWKQVIHPKSLEQEMNKKLFKRLVMIKSLEQEINKKLFRRLVMSMSHDHPITYDLNFQRRRSDVLKDLIII